VEQSLSLLYHHVSFGTRTIIVSGSSFSATCCYPGHTTTRRRGRLLRILAAAVCAACAQ
jgi:hypothetical protein